MISAKLCTEKLLTSLIMNLTSDFRNSKWRTQYGVHNILETQRFSWNFVLQGLGLADNELEIRFPFFEIADPIRRT